jgi:hypothetical protein
VPLRKELSAQVKASEGKSGVENPINLKLRLRIQPICFDLVFAPDAGGIGDGGPQNRENLRKYIIFFRKIQSFPDIFRNVPLIG